MQKPYDRIYKVRGLLMLPPTLFSVFVFYRETEWNAVVWPVGLAVFFLGVALRIWAQVHLHYRLKTRKVLTTTGPYFLVRNPIYIANTTMLLGLTIVSELLWFLPIMLLWCAGVYHFVVRREELHLTEKYGAPYLEFLASVPRWLPGFRRDTRDAPSLRRFVLPSIVAELHCLLWLLPYFAKEFWPYA